MASTYTYHGSRTAMDGSTAYVAWHSTDELDTYDVTTDTLLSTVTLQNYDGWVHGVSAPGNGTVYLLDTNACIHILNGSSPKLTGKSPFFFRVYPSDTLEGARMADLVGSLEALARATKPGIYAKAALARVEARLRQRGPQEPAPE